MVSDSVSKKSIGFGIEKIWYPKSFGFSFVQIWVILGKVSVLKLFHFLDGFGFGIENIWYQKSIGFIIENF